MTPIRPAGASPTPNAQAPQADTAKLAAQKAFFASLRQVGAPAAPASVAAAPAATPVAAPQAAAPQAVRAAATPAEPPQKILRPGSLFDIRV